MNIWSCGGGRQSGAIAALIQDGRLPKPEIAFMINTGREKAGTWPFVDGFIRPALQSVGLELTIVPKDEFAYVDLFSHKGDILLPGFTTQGGGRGKLEPYCSGEWKRDVASRWLKSIGIDSATMWVGISANEAHRIRAPRSKWLQLAYPLIFTVRMNVQQCVELIRFHGWTAEIPHSACYMCPNQGDSEWMAMKRHWPDDFTKACELEQQVRLKDPHFYLHPSCVPLTDVDFFAQRTMFSERGCTEGCFT